MGEKSKQVVIDLNHLQGLHNLSDEGENFLEWVIASYRERITIMIDELHAAHLDGAAHRVAFICHRIRASSINMGAIQTASLARKFEEWARAGDLSKIDEALLAEMSSMVLVTIDTLEGESKKFA